MFKNIDSIRQKFSGDDLLKGGLILFILLNIFNFLNYFFQFSMARMLGPADYGVLAVLMSIIYIFSIPTEAIQNVITRYTSIFNRKKEFGKIKFMLFKSLRKSFFASLLLFLLFLPLSYFLSIFLKIDFLVFAYLGLVIFFFFSLPIVRGVLQGEKKFSSLGVNLILDGLVKVSAAVSLVFLGWKVYGAISAILIGSLIAFLTAFFSLKDVLKVQKTGEEFKGIYFYSMPFFVSALSIFLIFSLDVIFARRFFPPEIAGKYAVAAMLGRIIFFGTFAISKAMFPIASEKHDSGDRNSYLLKKSLKIVGILSFLILLFYLFLPEIVISILFGSQYIEVSNILFILGLALTFLSFTNVIILYGLAIGKIKNSSFSFLIFSFIEIILFYVFHSSLLEYTVAFLVVNFIMLVYSLFLIRR